MVGFVWNILVNAIYDVTHKIDFSEVDGGVGTILKLTFPQALCCSPLTWKMIVDGTKLIELGGLVDLGSVCIRCCLKPYKRIELHASLYSLIA